MPEGQSSAVQIAIYNKLYASTELDALLARRTDYPTEPAIYDDVTQPPDTAEESKFPYVVIGDDSILDWSTDTASGGDVSAIIHVWSRYDGKGEAKRIQSAIYNALHRQTLTVPDHEFIGCDFDTESVTLDPDMHTYHGTSEYRIYIDEVGYGN